MKHTPGPWRVSKFNGATSIMAPGAETVVIEMARNKEIDANARAISLVPKMVEALNNTIAEIEMLCDQLTQMPMSTRRHAHALDTIASARAILSKIEEGGRTNG